VLASIQTFPVPFGVRPVKTHLSMILDEMYRRHSTLARPTRALALLVERYWTQFGFSLTHEVVQRPSEFDNVAGGGRDIPCIIVEIVPGGNQQSEMRSVEKSRFERSDPGRPYAPAVQGNRLIPPMRQSMIGFRRKASGTTYHGLR